MGISKISVKVNLTKIMRNKLYLRLITSLLVPIFLYSNIVYANPGFNNVRKSTLTPNSAFDANPLNNNFSGEMLVAYYKKLGGTEELIPFTLDTIDEKELSRKLESEIFTTLQAALDTDSYYLISGNIASLQKLITFLEQERAQENNQILKIQQKLKVLLTKEAGITGISGISAELNTRIKDALTKYDKPILLDLAAALQILLYFESGDIQKAIDTLTGIINSPPDKIEKTVSISGLTCEKVRIRIPISLDFPEIDISKEAWEYLGKKGIEWIFRQIAAQLEATHINLLISDSNKTEAGYVENGFVTGQALKTMQRKRIQIQIDSSIPTPTLRFGFTYVKERYPDYGQDSIFNQETLWCHVIPEFAKKAKKMGNRGGAESKPLTADNIFEGWAMLADMIEKGLKDRKSVLTVLIWGYPKAGKSPLCSIIKDYGIGQITPDQIDAYIEPEEHGQKSPLSSYKPKADKRLIIVDGFYGTGWLKRHNLEADLLVRINSEYQGSRLEETNLFNHEFQDSMKKDPSERATWDLIINRDTLEDLLLLRKKLAHGNVPLEDKDKNRRKTQRDPLNAQGISRITSGGQSETTKPMRNEDFIYIRNEKGDLVAEPVGFGGKWIVNIPSEIIGVPPNAVNAAVNRITKSVSLVLQETNQLSNIAIGYINIVEDIGNTDTYLPKGTYKKYNMANIVIYMAEGKIWVYATDKFLLNKPDKQREILKDILRDKQEQITIQDQLPLSELSQPQPAPQNRPRVLLFNNIEASEEEWELYNPAFFLGSALTHEGVDVQISTFPIEKYIQLKKITNKDDSQEKELKQLEDNLQEILGRNYDFIGLSLYDVNIAIAKSFIEDLGAKTKSMIAVGGPLPTLHPELVLAHIPQIQLLVRGEAEISFSKIVNAVHHNNGQITEKLIEQLKDVNGFWFRTGNKILINNLNLRNTLSNKELNQLTLDYSLLNPQYAVCIHMWTTSRGCPKQCKFCPHVHGYNIRQWTVDKIIQELLNYQARLEEIEKTGHSVPYLAFNILLSDDDFLLNPKRAQQLFKKWMELQGKGILKLKISKIQTSLESFIETLPGGERRIKQSLIDAIASAKQIFVEETPKISIGTDAFSDREIERFRKGKQGSPYTFSEIKEVVEALDKSNILNGHYLILTNPWTEDKDMVETLSNVLYLLETYPKTFYISGLNYVVIPNQLVPIYKEVQEEGKEAFIIGNLYRLPGFEEYNLLEGRGIKPYNLYFFRDTIEEDAFYLLGLKHMGKNRFNINRARAELVKYRYITEHKLTDYQPSDNIMTIIRKDSLPFSILRNILIDRIGSIIMNECIKGIYEIVENTKALTLKEYEEILELLVLCIKHAPEQFVIDSLKDTKDFIIKERDSHFPPNAGNNNDTCGTTGEIKIHDTESLSKFIDDIFRNDALKTLLSDEEIKRKIIEYAHLLGIEIKDGEDIFQRFLDISEQGLNIFTEYAMNLFLPNEEFAGIYFLGDAAVLGAADIIVSKRMGYNHTNHFIYQNTAFLDDAKRDLNTNTIRMSKIIEKSIRDTTTKERFLDALFERFKNEASTNAVFRKKVEDVWRLLCGLNLPSDKPIYLVETGTLGTMPLFMQMTARLKESPCRFETKMVFVEKNVEKMVTWGMALFTKGEVSDLSIESKVPRPVMYTGMGDNNLPVFEQENPSKILETIYYYLKLRNKLVEKLNKRDGSTVGDITDPKDIISYLTSTFNIEPSEIALQQLNQVLDTLSQDERKAFMSVFLSIDKKNADWEAREVTIKALASVANPSRAIIRLLVKLSIQENTLLFECPTQDALTNIVTSNPEAIEYLISLNEDESNTDEEIRRAVITILANSLKFANNKNQDIAERLKSYFESIILFGKWSDTHWPMTISNAFASIGYSTKVPGLYRSDKYWKFISRSPPVCALVEPALESAVSDKEISLLEFNNGKLEKVDGKDISAYLDSHPNLSYHLNETIPKQKIFLEDKSTIIKGHVVMGVVNYADRKRYHFPYPIGIILNDVYVTYKDIEYNLKGVVFTLSYTDSGEIGFVLKRNSDLLCHFNRQKNRVLKEEELLGLFSGKIDYNTFFSQDNRDISVEKSNETEEIEPSPLSPSSPEQAPRRLLPSRTVIKYTADEKIRLIDQIMTEVEDEIKKGEFGNKYFAASLDGNIQYRGTSPEFSLRVIRELGEKGLMGHGKKFGDIGAGIGRMVAAVAALTDVDEVVSIEMDHYLVEKGEKAIDRLDEMGVLDKDRIRWVQSDWRNAEDEIVKLDAVYIYPPMHNYDFEPWADYIRLLMRSNAYVFDAATQTKSGWGLRSFDRKDGMADGFDSDNNVSCETVDEAGHINDGEMGDNSAFGIDTQGHRRRSHDILRDAFTNTPLPIEQRVAEKIRQTGWKYKSLINFLVPAHKTDGGKMFNRVAMLFFDYFIFITLLVSLNLYVGGMPPSLPGIFVYHTLLCLNWIIPFLVLFNYAGYLVKYPPWKQHEETKTINSSIIYRLFNMLNNELARYIPSKKHFIPAINDIIILGLGIFFFAVVNNYSLIGLGFIICMVALLAIIFDANRSSLRTIKQEIKDEGRIRDGSKYISISATDNKIINEGLELALKYWDKHNKEISGKIRKTQFYAIGLRHAPPEKQPIFFWYDTDEKTAVIKSFQIAHPGTYDKKPNVYFTYGFLLQLMRAFHLKISKADGEEIDKLIAPLAEIFRIEAEIAHKKLNRKDIDLQAHEREITDLLVQIKAKYGVDVLCDYKELGSLEINGAEEPPEINPEKPDWPRLAKILFTGSIIIAALINLYAKLLPDFVGGQVVEKEVVPGHTFWIYTRGPLAYFDYGIDPYNGDVQGLFNKGLLSTNSAIPSIDQTGQRLYQAGFLATPLVMLLFYPLSKLLNYSYFLNGFVIFSVISISASIAIFTWKLSKEKNKSTAPLLNTVISVLLFTLLYSPAVSSIFVMCQIESIYVALIVAGIYLYAFHNSKKSAIILSSAGLALASGIKIFPGIFIGYFFFKGVILPVIDTLKNKKQAIREKLKSLTTIFNRKENKMFIISASFFTAISIITLSVFGFNIFNSWITKLTAMHSRYMEIWQAPSLLNYLKHIFIWQSVPFANPLLEPFMAYIYPVIMISVVAIMIYSLRSRSKDNFLPEISLIISSLPLIMSLWRSYYNVVMFIPFIVIFLYAKDIKLNWKRRLIYAILSVSYILSNLSIVLEFSNIIPSFAGIILNINAVVEFPQSYPMLNFMSPTEIMSHVPSISNCVFGFPGSLLLFIANIILLNGLNKNRDRASDTSKDIAGKSAKHREEINPKLKEWLELNKTGIKVIDYYSENGTWVPYKVEYMEDYGVERDDKGEKLTDKQYRLSEDEQRRLNETLESCTYDEIGKPVRFRVVLGETTVAWRNDLEHSSLVHVGERTATVWFGEGLFRDLLSMDNDPLRKKVFIHEKQHLLGRHWIDRIPFLHEELVMEVYERCKKIEGQKEEPEWIKGVKIVEKEPQGDKEIKFIGDNLGCLTFVSEAKYNGGIYFAKTTPISEKRKEEKYIVPQIKILDYLNKKGIPGICKIEHLLELEDGRKVILFEKFPEGETLENKIERMNKIPEKEAVEIILKVSRIVKSLLDTGVYHWDITPNNIWITNDNDVILFDFDLAFMAGEEFNKRRLFEVANLPYISKNRLQHADFSPSDEIYSLNKVLTNMLIGDRSFQEFYGGPYFVSDLSTKNQILINAIYENVYKIPEWLKVILCKTLSEGKDKYKTIDEFINALERAYNILLKNEGDRKEGKERDSEEEIEPSPLSPGSPVTAFLSEKDVVYHTTWIGAVWLMIKQTQAHLSPATSFALNKEHAINRGKRFQETSDTWVLDTDKITLAFDVQRLKETGVQFSEYKSEVFRSSNVIHLQSEGSIPLSALTDSSKIEVIEALFKLFRDNLSLDKISPDEIARALGFNYWSNLEEQLQIFPLRRSSPPVQDKGENATSAYSYITIDQLKEELQRIRKVIKENPKLEQRFKELREDFGQSPDMVSDLMKKLPKKHLQLKISTEDVNMINEWLRSLRSKSLKEKLGFGKSELCALLEIYLESEVFAIDFTQITGKNSWGKLKFFLKRINSLALSSIVSAVILTIIGGIRGISERYPGIFDGLFFSFLQRAPYDGSLWSLINVQCFKVLFIPVGIAVSSLAMRIKMIFDNQESIETRDEDKGPILYSHQLKLAFVLLGFVMASGVELGKCMNLPGFFLTFLPGENPYINHIVHIVSAIIGYFYVGIFDTRPILKSMEATIEEIIEKESRKSSSSPAGENTPVNEKMGAVSLLPNSGKLAGTTILRFANSYDNTGGIQTYLQYLNKCLLERNEMTIIQIYFTSDTVNVGIQEMKIGRGKLILVPILHIPPVKQSGEKEQCEKYLYELVKRWLSRLGIKKHILYWLSNTKFLKVLIKIPVLKLFYANRTIAYDVTRTRRIIRQILNGYDISLVMIHSLNLQDCLVIADEARKKSIPVILQHHGDNISLRDFYMKDLIPIAAGITGVNSKDVPKDLKYKYINLSDGIDTDYFNLKNAAPIDLEFHEPVILLPARIVFEKGHLDLLKIAKTLRDSYGKRCKFIFAGPEKDPGFSEKIRKFAEESGLLNDVIFAGDLSQEDLRSYYSISDIIVLPSKEEGLGRVILEAQSMEKPVVAYNTGGIPEALVDNKTGYLVNVGDIGKFAKLLNTLLEDRDLRISMGRLGREFVENNYSLRELAERHENFYLQVMEQNCRDRNVTRGTVSKSGILESAPFSIEENGVTTKDKAQRFSAFRYRILDIVIVMLCVLPALIIIVIFALLIKLTSRGPVLHIDNTRLGFQCQKLRVPKLRTYTEDGKEKTWLGKKLLRHSGLDELPQLWRVLTGEMSIFGPRPRPRERLSEEYIEKILKNRKVGFLSIFSAIFGPGKGDKLVEWDYLKFDEYEIKNWSTSLMIKIIWATICAILHLDTINDRFTFFGLKPDEFKRKGQKSILPTETENIVGQTGSNRSGRTICESGLATDARRGGAGLVDGQKEDSDKGDNNVSCGTVCQKGHEESYWALDKQLERQFEALKAVYGPRTMDHGLLNEEEADRALVEYAKGFGIDITIEQLRAYREKIREAEEGLRSIKIFFSIPEDGTELFWVPPLTPPSPLRGEAVTSTGEGEWTYAGGHFNQAGTRIHISLPIILKHGIDAGIAIAKHDLAHIKGEGHQDDEGMRIVKKIAKEEIEPSSKNQSRSPVISNTESLSVIELLRKEIAQKGRITFAEFMETALFSTNGYYSRGVNIGKKGEFSTSPEKFSPVFGAFLVRQFIQMWETLGRPIEFQIVEMGAGNGTMARDILATAREISPSFYKALKYTIVEISQHLARKQQQLLGNQGFPIHWVLSSAIDLSLKNIEGVLISNELPDAFPVHIVKLIYGSLKELYIGYKDGRFFEQWDAVSDSTIKDYIDMFLRLRDHYRVHFLQALTERRLAVNLNAIRWQERIAKIFTRGYVVTIDYGFYAINKFPLSTIATYGKNFSYTDLYSFPGEIDITSPIDFLTMLKIMEGHLTCEGVIDQIQFFANLGMDIKTLKEMYELYSEEGNESPLVAIQSKNVPPVELVGLKNVVSSPAIGSDYAKASPDRVVNQQSDSGGEEGDNVSCGTVCEKGHEGSYEALDEQLKRQFGTLKEILSKSSAFSLQPSALSDLTEEEADRALVEYVKGFGINITVEQLQEYRRIIKSYLVTANEPEASEAVSEIARNDIPTIFFAIPETGTELFWVNNDYAGGHFNKEGTRIHISLPIILKHGIDAGIAIAKHDLMHIDVIKGKRSEITPAEHEDEGLRIVKEIALKEGKQRDSEEEIEPSPLSFAAFLSEKDVIYHTTWIGAVWLMIKQTQAHLLPATIFALNKEHAINRGKRFQETSDTWVLDTDKITLVFDVQRLKETGVQFSEYKSEVFRSSNIIHLQSEGFIPLSALTDSSKIEVIEALFKLFRDNLYLDKISLDEIARALGFNYWNNLEEQLQFFPLRRSNSENRDSPLSVEKSSETEERTRDAEELLIHILHGTLPKEKDRSFIQSVTLIAALKVVLRHFNKGQKFSLEEYLEKIDKMSGYTPTPQHPHLIHASTARRGLFALADKGFVEIRTNEKSYTFKFVTYGWLDIIHRNFSTEQNFSIEDYLNAIDEEFGFNPLYLPENHIIPKRYAHKTLKKLHRKAPLDIRADKTYNLTFSMDDLYEYIKSYCRLHSGDLMETKIEKGTIDPSTQGYLEPIMPYLSPLGRKFIEEGSFKITKNKDYLNSLLNNGKKFFSADPKKFDMTILMGNTLWDEIKEIPEALAEAINCYALWYYNGPHGDNHDAELKFIRSLDTPLLDEISEWIYNEGAVDAIQFTNTVGHLAGDKTTRRTLKIREQNRKEIFKYNIRKLKHKYFIGPHFKEARHIANRILKNKMDSLKQSEMLDVLFYTCLNVITITEAHTTKEYLTRLNMLAMFAGLFAENYNNIIQKLLIYVAPTLPSGRPATKTSAGRQAERGTKAGKIQRTELYSILATMLDSATRKMKTVPNAVQAIPFSDKQKRIAILHLSTVLIMKDEIIELMKRDGGHNSALFEIPFIPSPQGDRSHNRKLLTETIWKLYRLANLGMFGKFIERVEKDIDPNILLDPKKPTVASTVTLHHNRMALLENGRRFYPEINWIILSKAGSNDGTTHFYMALFDKQGKLTYARLKESPTIDAAMTFPATLLSVKNAIPVVNSAPVELVASSKLRTYELLQGKPYLPMSYLIPPNTLSENLDGIVRFIKITGNNAVLKSDNGERAEEVHMINSTSAALQKAQMYKSKGFLIQERIYPPKIKDSKEDRDWIVRAFVERAPHGTVEVTGLIVASYRDGERLLEHGQFLLEDVLKKLKGVTLSEEEQERVIRDIKAVSTDAFKTLDTYVRAEYPENKYPCKSSNGVGPSFITVDLILDSRDMKPKLLEINGVSSGRIAGLQELLPPDKFEVGRGFLGILAKDAQAEFQLRNASKEETISREDERLTTGPNSRQREITNRFIDMLKIIPQKENDKKIILALDTDIGNMTQFDIGDFLRQIKDVSELLGNIEFVADKGASLSQTIQKTIRHLRTNGAEQANIEVVVVTKQNNEKFAHSYHVMRVDDKDLLGTVRILELLTFALKLHTEDTNDDTKEELNILYNEITGKTLTDEILGDIKKGEPIIMLRASPDSYKEAAEILKSA